MGVARDKTTILIGPLGAGKSTIAELVAAKTGMPTASLDQQQHYYRELGFDRDEFARVARGGSARDADRYFQVFFPGAVAKLLADYPGHVPDLGAGHTVFEDETLFEQVRETLAPYRNVVLVLPSPDPAESVRVLRERARDKMGAERFLNSDFDYFGYWVESPCNSQLAKLTVYIEGRTPEETADEVIERLELTSA